VLGGVYAGFFVASVNQTLTATALPQVVEDLGGLKHYSWVFTAYILASVVALPLYGKLSDVYGRRPLYVAAIALFCAGSAAAGVSQSMNVLIAGRALQGLGAGALGPLGLAVIADMIVARERGKWQAVSVTVLTAATVCGPLLGGWISDTVSWRLAFFASLPLAAGALAVIWFGFGQAGERHRRRIDYPGAALLAVGVAVGLFALSAGGEDYAWNSPVVLGLLATSALVLIAFSAWERRAKEPILPFALLRTRAIGSAIVGLFAVGAAMVSTVTFVPLFVQGVLEKSATSAGTALIPLTASWFLTSAVAGQLVSRTGRPRPVLLAGPPIGAVGFVLLGSMGTHTSIGRVVLAVVLVGSGFGLVMQTLILVVQDRAPVNSLGAATAAAEFFRWIGALLGVTAVGAIVAAGVDRPTLKDAGPEALADALRAGFGAGLVSVTVLFVAVLALPDIKLRASFEDAPAAEAPLGAEAS
jgi:EmrB/QacA subfamily drug resistance transporter